MWIAEGVMIDDKDKGLSPTTNSLTTTNIGSYPPGNTSTSTSSTTTPTTTTTPILNPPQWYKKANKYWDKAENCPSTVDGVLGGFAHLSPPDVVGSTKFLNEVIALTSGSCSPFLGDNSVIKRACDCGAGIGRVTKEFLLPFGFTHVDLVEQSERLLRSAPDYLGTKMSSKCRYLNLGLQEFQPVKENYQVIWIQWVIGHLTDIDFVSFFRRCVSGVTKNGGIVVVKDNVCNSEEFNVDKDDSSVTRSLDYLLLLFELSGVEIVHTSVQEGFPDDIFPVHMFALRMKQS